jgi:ribosomal protein S18 acetylase RimI-like enzyme
MPTDMTDLLNVGRSEAKHAAETLARAFFDYPLLKYYYPDDSKREKIAYYFVSYGVFSGTAYGEVYTTSINMEGIAVWILSDYYSVTFSKMIRSVPLSVILGLARHGFQKMKGVGDYLDGLHARLVPYRHMYLQMIGVDPQHQGKGLAGKLIRPMLARLDEGNLPCYLETLDEKNAGIYERFGFKVIDESVIPGTQLKCWAILRDSGK